MTLKCQDVYRSANGDWWQLLVDTVSNERVVRHLPNPASGGQSRDMPIDDFLRIDGSGPEFSAVRRALEAGGQGTSIQRETGFYWVQGPSGAEPAYWDGETWSMLSPVTMVPTVLTETPITPHLDALRPASSAAAQLP